MGYIKQSLHQYTVIDFCLDDILRIDWTCSFINLRELTCANQGIVEIEVRLPLVILLGNRQVSLPRKSLAKQQQH
jgi:hypothetical protein